MRYSRSRYIRPEPTPAPYRPSQVQQLVASPTMENAPAIDLDVPYTEIHMHEGARGTDIIINGNPIGSENSFYAFVYLPFGTAMGQRKIIKWVTQPNLGEGEWAQPCFVGQCKVNYSYGSTTYDRSYGTPLTEYPGMAIPAGGPGTVAVLEWYEDQWLFPLTLVSQNY